MFGDCSSVRMMKGTVVDSCVVSAGAWFGDCSSVRMMKGTVMDFGVVSAGTNGLETVAPSER